MTIAVNYRNQFGPFFDQDDPEIPVLGLIASEDQSPSYELDAMAIFAAPDGKYLVVRVSGCSCWPDLGGTDQRVCHSIADADAAVQDMGSGNYASLIAECQNKRWEVTQLVTTNTETP